MLIVAIVLLGEFRKYPYSQGVCNSGKVELLYIYMYIYKCVYIYTHTHMHTHIKIHMTYIYKTIRWYYLLLFLTKLLCFFFDELF